MKITNDQRSDIIKNFGIWLRAQRTSLPDRPTQGDIAKLAGLSRSHYSQIESGARGTKINSAIAIARAIGFRSEDDIASVVIQAGHGDIREIKPVIVDITGRGRGLGTFVSDHQHEPHASTELVEIRDTLQRIERDVAAMVEHVRGTTA
jgi:DNA-binding XRE family transcriptional regulator